MTETIQQVMQQAPNQTSQEIIEVEHNSKGNNWVARVFIKGSDEESLKRLSGIYAELEKAYGRGE